MKTKLYNKFIKFVCSDFKITKQQLFNREFDECIMHVYQFDIVKQKLIRDENQLNIFSRQHPLSQIWKTYDFKTRWLIKYWKHSHYKYEIKIRLDLGENIKDIIIDILTKTK